MPHHVEPGQQRGDLGDEADHLGRPRLGGAAPADPDRPAVGLLEAGDHPQQRRLPAAGRADDADEASPRHLQGDVVEGVRRHPRGSGTSCRRPGPPRRAAALPWRRPRTAARRTWGDPTHEPGRARRRTPRMVEAWRRSGFFTNETSTKDDRRRSRHACRDHHPHRHEPRPLRPGQGRHHPVGEFLAADREQPAPRRRRRRLGPRRRRRGVAARAGLRVHRVVFSGLRHGRAIDAWPGRSGHRTRTSLVASAAAPPSTPPRPPATPPGSAG